jgi:hypothetical protein
VCRTISRTKHWTWRGSLFAMLVRLRLCGGSWRVPSYGQFLLLPPLATLQRLICRFRLQHNQVVCLRILVCAWLILNFASLAYTCEMMLRILTLCSLKW